MRFYKEMYMVVVQGICTISSSVRSPGFKGVKVAPVNKGSLTSWLLCM